MNCPNCNTWNPEDKTVCWRCQADLPKPKPPKKKRQGGFPTWTWALIVALVRPHDPGPVLFHAAVGRPGQVGVVPLSLMAPTDHTLDYAANYAPVARLLVDWHNAHQRDLPWRMSPAGARNPYAVWISEVMLQQTRVEAVVGYYNRWMERFPTVDALAAADLQDVLKAWEGLGYYARARNLHRAAQIVAVRVRRRLPRRTGRTAGAARDWRVHRRRTVEHRLQPA